MGIGSASIVLVFAVLCLTVFSLISYLVAGNDKALVAAEAELVTGYYKADYLAEQILAEIIETGAIPEEVRGVGVWSEWDMEQNADIIHYACPVSDTKELYVKLAISDGTHRILSWMMVDTDEWEFDDTLDVWLGD